MEVKNEIQSGEDGLPEGLKEAAEEMLRAMEDKSVIGLAHALYAAFEICDSAPHEEYEHEE